MTIVWVSACSGWYVQDEEVWLPIIAWGTNSKKVQALEDGGLVTVEDGHIFHPRYSPGLPKHWTYDPIFGFTYTEPVEEPTPEPPATDPNAIVVRLGSGPTEVALPGATLTQGGE